MATNTDDPDHTLTQAPFTLPPAEAGTIPAPPHEQHAPFPETIAQTGRPPFFPGTGILDIPGYTVQGEIARGGMGVVLAAHDQQLARDVAVKVLHPGTATQDAAQRFVIESKITACLAHPAIPPVYQLGTLPDGNPFLAMKLIRGRTLADELKASDRKSELPRFVQIFEQISQAVGFAHAQSVLHRDLKPANVMVGAFGEVQVMDWGLALVLTDSEREQPSATPSIASSLGSIARTELGYVVGTPAYMAPEQARGERLCWRADVFALGGILCDILTGHPPFAGTTVRDTVRLAAEGNVTVAFSRLDSCDADPELVAIAKCCLDPKAENRPCDGKTVANLVATYRAGVEERLRRAETERAAAEARATEEANTRREVEARIVEQRKRRQVQLALVGSLLAIMGLVAIGAWWENRQAEQRKLERLEAEARTSRSEAARLTAEAEMERQRRDVRERLIRNRDAITRLLEQTEAALRRGDTERAEEAFEQAEKRSTEGGADDLKPQLDRCRVDLNMLRELDLIDRERWTQVDGMLPDWEMISPRFLTAFTGYGITPATTPLNEAARRMNDSLIRERLLTSLEFWFVNGGRDTNLQSILLATDPDEFRNEARKTNYLRAVISQAFKRKPSVAVQPTWFAVGHGQDQRVDRGPREQLLLSAHRLQPNNFSLLMALGILGEPGDREQAPRSAGWYRAALALQPRNVPAWNNLGVALKDSGDLQGAIEAYRQAVRLDPKDPSCLSNLAVALNDLGDKSGAIARYREAIRLDPKYVRAHINLGIALESTGDAAGAITALREAIRLEPKNAKAHSNLGVALKATGDFPGAIAAYREALQLNPNDPKTHSNLGIALVDSGKVRDAIPAYKEAIRLDPRNAAIHTNLAVAYIHLQQYPEAIASARTAIQLNVKSANAHAVLGLALLQSGDVGGGRKAFAEAARLDSQKFEQSFRQLFPMPLAPLPRAIQR